MWPIGRLFLKSIKKFICKSSSIWKKKYLALDHFWLWSSWIEKIDGNLFNLCFHCLLVGEIEGQFIRMFFHLTLTFSKYKKEVVDKLWRTNYRSIGFVRSFWSWGFLSRFLCDLTFMTVFQLVQGAFKKHCSELSFFTVEFAPNAFFEKHHSSILQLIFVCALWGMKT